MRKWLVMWGCLLAGVTHAQLRVQIADASATPIELRSVSVKAEIAGRLAQTDIELQLNNPNGRVLEGELNFALLDGQTVSGFALDINGVLREAVPVEKARGQAVFEEVVRGNVDPALLEKTAGNNFKLRVYPLPPNGARRVVLRITETLKAGGYRLPLEFGGRVGTFSIDIHSLGLEPPTAKASALGEIKFIRDKGWRGALEVKDFLGRGALEVSLGKTANAPLYTQAFDGKRYFMLEVPLPERAAPRSLPRTIALVWDSSGSAAGRDHSREFKLLSLYFARVKNAEVRLLRLRNTLEPAQIFQLRDGQWDALKSALDETPYDGASALGALSPQRGVDEYLLVSDGLSTWGAQPIPDLRAPLYAISSSVGADLSFLRHYARRNGGQLLDLGTLSPELALADLLKSVSFISRLDGSNISELVSSSRAVEGGSVLVAGVLNELPAELKVTLTEGNRSKSIAFPLRSGLDSSLVAKHWASLRVAELDGEYALNASEIRRLGKRFGLLTRETSLIVLDLAADYARFEIEPPRELRDEYLALRQQQRASDQQERVTHIEEVISRFNEKRAWWNTDFPKLKMRMQDDAKLAEAASGASSAERSAMSAPPESAPVAEAMMAAPVVAQAPAASRQESASLGGTIAAAAEVKKADTKDKSAADARPMVATIQLKKFSPDSAELKRLRAASKADLYRVYLDERPSFVNSTAFFLDAADVFIERGQPELGLRILSNLAEISLDNRAILRVLGYRLAQLKRHQEAITVFRAVLKLSPDEPQSYRDLGLALAANGDAQLAIAELSEVVKRPWHNRFPEVELIALAELNAIAARSSKALNLSDVDPRLRENLALDLRAVLSWDADNTDIDLWVTDPNGDKAYYGRRLTSQGARMSLDFTGGYGPEEFSLKQALPGTYKVEAQYFGDRSQNLAGATTLQLNLSTHFGRKTQADQSIALRLNSASETVFVGEFTVQ